MTSHYRYKDSLKSDESDEPINVYLQRPLAGLVTWVLFPTRVTPNQLTITAIIFGCCGGLLLALHDPPLMLAALSFYLKDILDSADGQLARAKKLFSRRGRFLDSIGDFIVNIALFAGICILLMRSNTPPAIAAAVGIAGFLGVSLRVSYHVFYQTSFLHQKNLYATNRITEELTNEDVAGDASTLLLQKIFLVLYGWQDRLMVRLDRWCCGVATIESTIAGEWYGDRTGLRIGGLIGFGTEYVLLTLSLLLGSVTLYLCLTLAVLNLVWIVAIAYRRMVLRKKIAGKNRDNVRWK